jgi:hypothetical protein
MGATGLTGAGAGGIVGGGAAGVLQPDSHKATTHATPAKREDLKQWAM